MIYEATSLDDFKKEEGSLTKYNGKYYYFSDGNWKEINKEFQPINGTGNVTMSIYEINQQIYSQLKKLTDEEIKEKVDLLNTFYKNRKENKYFAMLSWELHYFTVFVQSYFMIDFNTEEQFGDAVIDCLSYVGDIKSIELNQDNNDIEIWVTTPNEQTECIHLFPYDNGVVPFGG